MSQELGYMNVIQIVDSGCGAKTSATITHTTKDYLFRQETSFPTQSSTTSASRPSRKVGVSRPAQGNDGSSGGHASQRSSVSATEATAKSRTATPRSSKRSSPLASAAGGSRAESADGRDSQATPTTNSRDDVFYDDDETKREEDESRSGADKVDLPATPLALVNSTQLPKLQGKLQALPAPAKERLASINQQQGAGGAGRGQSVTTAGLEEVDSKLGPTKVPADGTANMNEAVTTNTEAGKEGGLGPRWPKGMWDVMDSHWRMIMAPGEFVVTPRCYNRAFDLEFRQTKERISNHDLERTRRKVKKWISESNQHFAI